MGFMFEIFFWNIRGIKKKNLSLSEVVKTFCNTHSIQMIALAETISNTISYLSTIFKFGFQGVDIIPCQDRSRRIRVLRNTNKIIITVIHKEVIFISIRNNKTGLVGFGYDHLAAFDDQPTQHQIQLQDSNLFTPLSFPPLTSVFLLFNKTNPHHVFQLA